MFAERFTCVIFFKTDLIVLRSRAGPETSVEHTAVLCLRQPDGRVRPWENPKSGTSCSRPWTQGAVALLHTVPTPRRHQVFMAPTLL